MIIRFVYFFENSKCPPIITLLRSEFILISNDHSFFGSHDGAEIRRSPVKVGSLIPLFIVGWDTSKRWLGRGFLNNQQDVQNGMFLFWRRWIKKNTTKTEVCSYWNIYCTRRRVGAIPCEVNVNPIIGQWMYSGGRKNMCAMQKALVGRLFRGLIGIILPSYIEIIVNPYEDPY